MRIKGKVAIVTGGASGLGEATVRFLHSAGAKVIIADTNRTAGDDLSLALGSRVSFIETDVTSDRSMQSAVKRARKVHKALHILVNCAGVAIAKKIISKEIPHDLCKFRQVIDVNLVGTFNALRLGAEAMANNVSNHEGERGVIINTSSVSAFEGQIGQAAYAASKAGVAGLTLPASRELARHGIRVITIAPGIFDTPLMAGLPEKARDSLAQQVPFPSRLGRPEEFALLVGHIIENVMLNGENVRLDGALRMASR